MDRRVIGDSGWGYVQANEIRGSARVLLCSGQTATGPDGTVMGVGDIGAQIGYALDGLEGLLREAAMGLDDVVRLNVFTTDVPGFMERWGDFTSRLQAAGAKQTTTVLGVVALGLPDLLVELEATAVAD